MAAPLGAPAGALIARGRGARNARQQAADTGFESWWAEWPNKKARKEAERAWCQLAPGVRSRMVDLTKDYLARRTVAEASGAFVPALPHGATYLRNERWTDQFEPAPGAAGAASLREQWEAEDHHAQ